MEDSHEEGGVNKGWLERIEACPIARYPCGCLVRQTMQLQRADGTWSYDSSMCFVPNAKILSNDDPDEPGSLIYELVF
jgi:hypothetical protein